MMLDATEMAVFYSIRFRNARLFYFVALCTLPSS